MSEAIIKMIKEVHYILVQDWKYFFVCVYKLKIFHWGPNIIIDLLAYLNKRPYNNGLTVQIFVKKSLQNIIYPLP